MRSLPDNNLDYPISVPLSDGTTGSGFLLNGSDHGYIVTARHVLYDETGALRAREAKLIAFGRTPSGTGRRFFKLDLETLDHSGDLYTPDGHDICGTRISDFDHDESGTPTRGSVRERVIVGGDKEARMIGVGLNVLKLFDEILVGNDVFIMGFPASIGLPHLPQIDYDRPLVRKGIVVGLNKSSRTVILDCQVHPGNSGGIVIETEFNGALIHYKVIGVVSEFVPFAQEVHVDISDDVAAATLSNSGYSVMSPLDPLLELIGEDVQ